MSYQEFLNNKAQAAYDKTNNRIIGSLGFAGETALSIATGGLSGRSSNQQPNNTVPVTDQYQNSSPRSMRFNDSYDGGGDGVMMNPLLTNPQYSGYSVNREGTQFGPNLIPVIDANGNIIGYKSN